MFYALAILWGIGQGCLIANLLSTAQSLSKGVQVTLLVGLNFFAEGIGALTCTPLLGM